MPPGISPFMARIIFCMPPFENCFIIFWVCSNWLRRRLTSCTVTPAPAAMPAADPIIVPPAPVDLTGTLQKVGLELVETSHSAPPADSFAPAQPLGRKPKPAPVIVNEPLQMVETKND